MLATLFVNIGSGLIQTRAYSYARPVLHKPNLRTQASAPPLRQVNTPFVDVANIDLALGAVFWFGQVTPTTNYVDVRTAYNRTALSLQVNVFDRHVRIDDNSAHNSFAELTKWDTAVFYLETAASAGGTPSATTYRYVAQINWANEQPKFHNSARGNGTGWAELGNTLPFTTTGVWRGNGPNAEAEDRGWWLNFQIPFKNFGLAEMPAAGTRWRLGVQLFDRDDAAGTPIAPQAWPDGFKSDAPNSWGQLTFGWPASAAASMPTNAVTVTVRNDATTPVMDAPVGGGSVCADPYANDYFSGFGTANYAKAEFFNIQNQGDVADWPCFSKFYITFPLTSLTAGKSVISATLTAIQFGNSGQGGPPEPDPDWGLVHVLTVAEDWQDSTLNWNNAPLALENISRSWVSPVKPPPPVPSVPITWDVSKAVDAAYRSGQPLRLVLYSADGARNSGKYFWTGHMNDVTQRPTLKVILGTAVPAATPTPLPASLNKHTYLPVSLQ